MKEAATPTRKWAQVTDNPALMSFRSIFLRPQETAASPDFCSQYKTKLDIVGLGGAGWAVAVGCQVGGDHPTNQRFTSPKMGSKSAQNGGSRFSRSAETRTSYRTPHHFEVQNTVVSCPFFPTTMGRRGDVQALQPWNSYAAPL